MDLVLGIYSQAGGRSSRSTRKSTVETNGRASWGLSKGDASLILVGWVKSEEAPGDSSCILKMAECSPGGLPLGCVV